MPDGTLLGEHLLDEAAKDNAAPGEAKPKEPVPGSSEERLARIEAALAAVPKQIDEGLKRIKQSQRDVVEDRVSRAKNTLEADILERVKPALEKAGVNLSEVRRQAFLDRQIDGAESGEAPAGESPKAEPASSSNESSLFQKELKSILSEHGLNGTEPELREYMRQHTGEPWYKAGAGFAELAETVGSRKKQGTLMPGSGDAPPPPNLVDAYKKEVLEARSKGEGMVGKRRIDAKFQKLGLKVENVSWTI